MNYLSCRIARVTMLNPESMKRTAIRTCLVLFLLVAGAAKAHEGTAEVSFDGLVKLQRGLFKESWVDMDVDFSQYTKIIPIDPYFEFRAVKRTSSQAARNSNQRKFYISDSNRERLIETVSAIFAEELAKSEHFTIVDEPGPDVMILRGGVFDIVSRVPPDQVGRNEVYLSSVGEGTLVLELRDSLSLETIYRGVERRAAQQSATGMRRSNTVTNWAEVRRLARRWAVKAREGLDAIHN